MFATKNTTEASTVPQLFYRFEITGADGEIYPVVISEDGLFLRDPQSTENFDHQLEAVLQP